MNKHSGNNSGFSAVVVLAVVVAVAVIGVGGLVYKGHHKTATISTTVTSSTNYKTPTPVKDETASWTKVTSGQSSFSVKVPDGWNIQNWTSRDYLYAASYTDLTYTAGKSAVVTSGDTNSIDSGPPRHFDITGNPIAQKSVVATPNVAPQDCGIVSGVPCKKYVLTYDSDGDGVKKGDKSYQYRLEGAKTLLTVNYYVLANETDQVSLVEKTIKTLSFE